MPHHAYSINTMERAAKLIRNRLVFVFTVSFENWRRRN
jgi:hypothetical protein